MGHITLYDAIRRLVNIGMPSPLEFDFRDGGRVSMYFGGDWNALDAGSEELGTRNAIARSHFTLLALEWYLTFDKTPLEFSIQKFADLAGLLDAVVNAAEAASRSMADPA